MLYSSVPREIVASAENEVPLELLLKEETLREDHEEMVEGGMEPIEEVYTLAAEDKDFGTIMHAVEPRPHQFVPLRHHGPARVIDVTGYPDPVEDE